MASTLTQFLGDHLAGDEHVGPLFENGRDDREPLNRFRTDRFQTAKTIEGRLDRPGDQQLDLLRREARCFGLHHHLGLHKIGEDIQLGMRSHVNPVAEDDTSQHDDDTAKAQRELNNGLEHQNYSSALRDFSSSERSCCAPVTTTFSPGSSSLVTSQPFLSGRSSLTCSRSNLSSAFCK